MKQTTFSLLSLIDTLPRWYDVVLCVWMVTHRQNNDGGCVWLTNETKWIQMKLQIRNLNNWKRSKYIFLIFNSFIFVNIQQTWFNSVYFSVNSSVIFTWLILGLRFTPNQQTTFCLTRLHMTLQTTLTSSCNIAGLF